MALPDLVVADNELLDSGWIPGVVVMCGNRRGVIASSTATTCAVKMDDTNEVLTKPHSEIVPVDPTKKDAVIIVGGEESRGKRGSVFSVDNVGEVLVKLDNGDLIFVKMEHLRLYKQQ